MCRSGTGGRWNLQGVVSWGDAECGSVYKPDVYTDVTYYKSWIQRNIGESYEHKAPNAMPRLLVLLPETY